MQRDTLKDLIRVTGAECTDSLTRENTHVLCSNLSSKKALAAGSWGIKVVNHLWIMDSVLTWVWQPDEKYDKSGEEILAEGIWTLLDDTSAGAKSMHPRFISEERWSTGKEAAAATSEEEEEGVRLEREDNWTRVENGAESMDFDSEAR